MIVIRIVCKTEEARDPIAVLTSSEKLAYRHIPLYMRKKTKMTMETAAAGKIK